MGTFFTVSAIVAIVMILGKLAKEFFKWVTKAWGKAFPRREWMINKGGNMETVFSIAFIVFVLGRVLFGKEDGKPKTRQRHFVHREDEDGHEKYPPSYY